jgi:hypothetical protein
LPREADLPIPSPGQAHGARYLPPLFGSLEPRNFSPEDAIHQGAIPASDAVVVDAGPIACRDIGGAEQDRERRFVGNGFSPRSLLLHGDDRDRETPPLPSLREGSGRLDVEGAVCGCVTIEAIRCLDARADRSTGRSVRGHWQIPRGSGGRQIDAFKAQVHILQRWLKMLFPLNASR